MIFFFFSSRRRHTRWTGDWSSDVCSSDLVPLGLELSRGPALPVGVPVPFGEKPCGARSEERRVGKECRSRGAPDRYKKQKLNIGKNKFMSRQKIRSLQVVRYKSL